MQVVSPEEEKGGYGEKAHGVLTLTLPQTPTLSPNQGVERMGTSVR